MNDCLVTRLKGVCDNDNLLKYNEVRIHVKTVANQVMQFVAADGIDAKVTIIPDVGSTMHFTDSGYTENLGTEITVAAGQNAYFTPGAGTFNIIGKYDFFDLAFRGAYNAGNIITVNLSDFAYSTKIIRFMLNGSIESTGELFDLSEFNAITAMDLGGCTEISGDISLLNTPSQVFTYLSLNGSGVIGNIVSLGSDIYLTTLKVSSTAIVGTLESFCETQIANGRNSGTLSFTGQNSSVTYNGNPITAPLTITFSNGTYTVE